MFLTMILCQINYSKQADVELDDRGVLRNAVYACRVCVRWLPKQPKTIIAHNNKNNSDLNFSHRSPFATEAMEVSDSSDDDEEQQNQHITANSTTTSTTTANNNNNKRLSPPMALVNGHFKGQTPPQLANLNRTELSMVSLINCVYTLCVLKPNSNVPTHYGTTGTVFSIMNDLHSIASILPRIPSLNEVAFMRSADSQSHVDFEYSPHKVLVALEWLSENNSLYIGKLEHPAGEEWVENDNSTSIPLSFIPLYPGDMDGCDTTTGLLPMTEEDGHAANPSAPVSGISDVLLIPSEENRDLITQIERIVETATRYFYLFIVCFVFYKLLLVHNNCLLFVCGISCLFFFYFDTEVSLICVSYHASS